MSAKYLLSEGYTAPIGLKKSLILLLVSIFYSFVAQAELKVSNIIKPVEYFIDPNNQFEKIEENLRIFGKTGIKGVSGMGKTQLARAYASRNIDKYNLIWFLESNRNLDEEFVVLAKEINKQFITDEEEKLPTTRTNARKAVINYLTTKKNWLLVFDNLKLNQGQFIEDIEAWENNGRIIICSQDIQHNGLYPLITLHPFTKSASTLLVKSITKDSAIGEELINKLVDIFQGYPVLTAQGAIFLRDNKIVDAEKYREYLADSGNRIKSSIQFAIRSLSPNARDLIQQLVLVDNHHLTTALILKFAHHPDTLTQDLQSLSRFGLSIDSNDELFEIHDMIKDSVLSLMDTSQIKSCLEDVITRINARIPIGVGSGRIVVADDQLRGSMEQLLINTERYNIDIYKVLELRKNLLHYYLGTRDHCGCQQMQDWLKKNDKLLIKTLGPDRHKALYGRFLAIIGTYEDFVKADTIVASSYLSKAQKIIKGLKGHPETVFYVNAQAAQLKIFNAQIREGQSALAIAEEVVRQNPKADLDFGLFWHLKTKLSLTQGRYEEALSEINEAIKANSHLPRDTFTAPAFILRASILNYLGRYEEAYREASAIYDQEIRIIKNPHPIHARILTHLARASAYIGKEKKALGDIEKAIEIYLAHYNLLPSNITSAKDDRIADALVAKGEILNQLNRPEEAIKIFEVADEIYCNRYLVNKKYMDEVAYLYWRAIQATKNENLPNRKYWYQVFSEKYQEGFGMDNAKGQEILAIGQTM